MPAVCHEPERLDRMGARPRLEPSLRLSVGTGSRWEGGGNRRAATPGPSCSGAGGLELPVPAWARRGAETPAGGPASRRHRSQLEGAAPAPQGVQAAGDEEEQPDRGGGRGSRTGRLRVGPHAGQSRGVGSSAAGRLRSIQRTESQMLKEGGVVRGTAGERSRLLCGRGRQRPRDPRLLDRAASRRIRILAALAAGLTGVYQQDSPSKRTSGDLSPRPMRDNVTLT